MNDLLNDTQSWAIIVGLLTPFLVSVVAQPGWSKRTRAVTGVAVAIVVGLLNVLATGGFTDTQTVLSGIALVYLSSATAYKALWKPTEIAPALESATSPSSGHRTA